MMLAMLDLFVSATKLIGRVHAPFTHKLVTAADYRSLTSRARPGDVLISKIRGELSNMFIPGEWTHAAIIDKVQERSVIEAIGSGVRRTDLIDFMMRKDYVALMRPIFATEEQQYLAARHAERWLGRPYDYEFKSGTKAFYCSELVWWSYAQTLGKDMPFHMLPRFGKETVFPSDFYAADKLWRVVWINRHP